MQEPDHSYAHTAVASDLYMVRAALVKPASVLVLSAVMRSTQEIIL